MSSTPGRSPRRRRGRPSPSRRPAGHEAWSTSSPAKSILSGASYVPAFHDSVRAPPGRTGPLASKLKVLRTKLKLKEKEIDYLFRRVEHAEKQLADSQSAHRGAIDKMVAIEDLFVDNLESFKKLELERKALDLGLSQAEALAYADTNAPGAVETDLNVLCTLGTVKEMLVKAEQVAERNVSTVRQQLSRRENEVKALQSTQGDLEDRVQSLEALLRVARQRAEQTARAEMDTRQRLAAQDALRKEAQEAEASIREAYEHLTAKNAAYRARLAQLSRNMETFIGHIKEETMRRVGYIPPTLDAILESGVDLLQL